MRLKYLYWISVTKGVVERHVSMKGDSTAEGDKTEHL